MRHRLFKLATLLLALTVIVLLAVLITVKVWRKFCVESNINKVSEPYYNEDDAKFVNRVREAVINGVSPELVEDYVRRRATLNTLRAEDKLQFGGVSIDPDESEHVPFPPIHSAHIVIYWTRDVRSDEPKCIGIAWMSNGKVMLFFGVFCRPL